MQPDMTDIAARAARWEREHVETCERPFTYRGGNYAGCRTCDLHINVRMDDLRIVGRRISEMREGKTRYFATD